MLRRWQAREDLGGNEGDDLKFRCHRGRPGRRAGEERQVGLREDGADPTGGPVQVQRQRSPVKGPRDSGCVAGDRGSVQRSQRALRLARREGGCCDDQGSIGIIDARQRLCGAPWIEERCGIDGPLFEHEQPQEEGRDARRGRERRSRHRVPPSCPAPAASLMARTWHRLTASRPQA
jgi:hypothetical protein